MTIKVRLIQPVMWTVVMKGGIPDYEEMKNYPEGAIEYFKQREKEKTSLNGMIWWEDLESVINKFLETMQITRIRLIDIKYQHFGNSDYENNTALVIYESNSK